MQVLEYILGVIRLGNAGMVESGMENSSVRVGTLNSGFDHAVQGENDPDRERGLWSQCKNDNPFHDSTNTATQGILKLWWVNLMATDPLYQQRGFGSALVSKICNIVHITIL